MNKITLIILTGLLMIAPLTAVQAAVSTDQKPFKVIAKMEYDRSQHDPLEIIHQVTDVLLENIEEASNGELNIVESYDGMEPDQPIKVLHFPPAEVNGEIQYGAQIEVWTDNDNAFITSLGAKYGVATPWNICVVSSPDMMGMMMGMIGGGGSPGETDPSGDKKDYILVTMVNPLAISKTVYRDLNWSDNSSFNRHCKNVTRIINKSTMAVLKADTDYRWKASYSELIYNGLAIKQKDVKNIPLDQAMPSLYIAGASADTVASNYTDYVRTIPPMFKPGGQLECVGKTVTKLFTDLFAWMDPNMPFDCDLTQPPYCGPVVHFDNLDDFKAKFPEMINQMFMPLWRQNLVGQPWKYIRRFGEGENNEVNVVEMCSKFYASMATGTGFHHAPALPCMLGFYNDENCANSRCVTCPPSCGSNVNMLTASAAFAWFFKDAAMMMDMMNMPVQAFMFEKFPLIINYEISALVNGGLQNAGVPERMPLPLWQ